MTKKELLMTAAKAYWGDEIDDVCSIEWSEQDDAVLYTHGDNQDHNGRDRTYRWDPLEEDFDTLPLAAKLRIDIRHWDGPDRVSAEHPSLPECSIMEEAGDDVNAAIRRVVTRAAAETRARADEAALVVARGRP